MATPSTSSRPLTGDPLIDAATHGYTWQLSTDRTLKWALANGFAGEYWTSPSTTAPTIAAAFQTFSRYANVNFTYLGLFSDPLVAFSSGSDITVSLGGSAIFGLNTSIWAIGLFPNAAYNTEIYQGAPGDAFLNINSQANYLTSYAPGSAGFFLILHEAGHILGLKHPHDDGGVPGRPTLSQLGLAELDKDWFTVMSYNDDFNYNLTSWDPATPMALDVLALEYIYGKNLSTNTGDTSHFLTANDVYQTIWDASGADTVDVSPSAAGWDIQLPDLQLSSLVDTRVGWASLLSEASLASPHTWYWLTGDVENARGSAFADVLTGSGGNNVLWGNAGNDTIDGQSGDDDLDGGAGNDTLRGGAGHDRFDKDRNGRGGSDRFEGGPGDDIYYIDSLTDVAVEALNEGNDLVWTPFSYSLATSPNVENAILSGAGAGTLIGSALSNGLWGSAGADELLGAGGNDLLIGAGGDDTLFGGAGNDRLMGGGGVDTARFELPRDSYTWRADTLGLQVINGTEVDTLRGIERLQFSDVLVSASEFMRRRDDERDFNGDGLHDLMWRSRTNGEIVSWEMSETGAGARRAGSVNGDWAVVANSGDYNGDGRSDVLWRHIATGQVATWEMLAFGALDGYDVGSANTSWVIVDATGDYNGDGRSDLLWRNVDSGVVATWEMSGSGRLNGYTIGGINNGWRIISASADYNGDGRSDVLWRHVDTGVVFTWQMLGGGTFTADHIGGVHTGWTIVDATGDYDGDGRDDILWRDTDAGTLVTWQMQGSGTFTSFVLGGVNMAWKVVEASADYSGDRRDDVLWRHVDSGAVALWEMNGGRSFSGSSIGGVSNAWKILEAERDYDSDGRDDLLWQGDESSPLVVWQMNGGAAFETLVLTPTTSEWSFVA